MSPSFKPFLLLAGLIAAPAVSAESLPAPAVPATLWVTQLGAEGPGSLRAAIETANLRPGPDRIRFARGLAGFVPISGSSLTISDPLHLQGPGGNRIRLRGDGQNGILRVTAAAEETTVEGLELTDAGDSAIVNEGAALSVDGCTLRANFGARGGAIASYGGHLGLRRTIVRDNYAEVRGGDLDGLGGGIYASQSSLTIESSRLSTNTAEGIGGGLYADLPAEGALLLRDSLVDANAAWTQGGGLALHVTGDPPTLILNSTVSGNRSTRNAAIWFDGSVIINNGTVMDNYGPAMEIPGLCPGLCGAGKNSELWLTSTLVSANRDADGNGYDLLPTRDRTHISHSLIERLPEGAAFDDRGGNLLNVDPRIGPLLDNGGALPTHALSSDSPAIDAGLKPSPLQYDQRGACHSRVVGAAADIGAYEYRLDGEQARRQRQPLCLPLRVPRR